MIVLGDNALKVTPSPNILTVFYYLAYSIAFVENAIAYTMHLGIPLWIEYHAGFALVLVFDRESPTLLMMLHEEDNCHHL